MATEPPDDIGKETTALLLAEARNAAKLEKADPSAAISDNAAVTILNPVVVRARVAPVVVLPAYQSPAMRLLKTGALPPLDLGLFKVNARVIGENTAHGYGKAAIGLSISW